MASESENEATCIMHCYNCLGTKIALRMNVCVDDYIAKVEGQLAGDLSHLLGT